MSGESISQHRIAKPVVFISHATSDAAFANAVKVEIEKIFANGVDVFCTSSPGVIAPGTDWLSGIERNLSIAKAVVAIVTPTSIERPWLWFEIGATWSKGRGGECRIYPLCVKEVDLSALPAPLDRLQALSLGRASDIKLMFDELIKQFGFGNIKTFKAENIINRVPKYNKITVDSVDIEERVFYSGKYRGYSDNELRDVLDEYFVKVHDSDFRSRFGTEEHRNLFLGHLLHYRQIDAEFGLPPGTAKKHLISVAVGYGAKVEKETSNTVRFIRKRDV